LHSKIQTGAVNSRNPLWVQAMNEANGETYRIPGEKEINLIHTQKISLVNRIRIARRNGFTKSVVGYVKRRLSRVHEITWRSND